MKKEDKANVISGFVFNGVVWDGKAIEAICSIAHALENLTQVFASQNIHIDSMVSIQDEKKAE